MANQNPSTQKVMGLPAFIARCWNSLYYGCEIALEEVS